jgi:hypothetical protein
VVADVPRSTKWKVRVIAFGGLLAGLTFLAIPPLVDWSLVVPLWIFGLPLTGVFGYMIGYGLIFRLRHPDPAERAAARERVLDTGPGASPHARSFFARQATKDKDRVLRSGVDGTAVVTFIADGHMKVGFAHLVYLELDVTVAGAPPCQVRTGELLTPAATGTLTPGRQLVVKVDPEDPQRVAVDWEGLGAA